MSKRIFVVSPDYIPKQFLEWHRLNMAFQHDLGEAIELCMPSSVAEYRYIVTQSRPDIVFANPFDAGWLIADYDFTALAKPVETSDEVVIFCRATQDLKQVRDISKNMIFASMANRGIEMLGLRLLEVANLDKDSLRWRSHDYFQGVVRMVRDGEADAGLILATVFDELHPFVRNHFRVLIRSAMEDVSHLFLVRGDDGDLHTRLGEILAKSRRQTRYYSILREINCRRGFSLMNDEDGRFLADVLETLKD